MDSCAFDPLPITTTQQRKEMIDVTMNVAVGEEPQEMECGMTISDPFDEVPPDVGLGSLEERSLRNRPSDELRALIKNAPRPEHVVPDLAIAHIAVGRHPDGPPVSDELCGRSRFGEPIERRGASEPDCIRPVATSYADSIHDTDDDGSLQAGEPRILLERPLTHRSSPLTRPHMADRGPRSVRMIDSTTDPPNDGVRP